jgi:hypothetical protein
MKNQERRRPWFVNDAASQWLKGFRPPGKKTLTRNEPSCWNVPSAAIPNLSW